MKMRTVIEHAGVQHMIILMMMRMMMIMRRRTIIECAGVEHMEGVTHCCSQ